MCEPQQLNRVEIEGDVATLYLQKGMTATLDAADADLLMGRRWHAVRSFRVWYVYGTTRKVRKYIQLHRLIMGLDGPIVDHKDHDGLNNRRSNLRHCTNRQNIANARSRVSAGKYRGVHRIVNRFRTYFRGVGIGHFLTEEEAAHAYDYAAFQEYGEFATLNFPDEIPAAVARAPKLTPEQMSIRGRLGAAAKHRLKLPQDGEGPCRFEPLPSAADER